MRRPGIRQLRSPAIRVLVVLVLLSLFLLPWHSRPRLSLSPASLTELWALPRDDVTARYEEERIAELARQGFDAVAAAKGTRTPPTLPDGTEALSSDSEVYVSRLRKFVAANFAKSPVRDELEDAVNRIARHAPPKSGDLPKLLFSTDRLGEAGVADLFRLWNALLPIPLAPQLADLLPETQWAESARLGGAWKSVVADDGQIDAQATQWVGESVNGQTEWGRVWRRLNFGVLRADFYRCVRGKVLC